MCVYNAHVIRAGWTIWIRKQGLNDRGQDFMWSCAE